tara:strand:- start:94 stop:768 length:675 start_codon:yes stop_codon:yes gene_type:complete
MKQVNSFFQPSNPIKGVYGDFIVTPNDKREVLFYRLSILFCGLFFFIGITYWFYNGSHQGWFWLLGISTSLGLSLKWIHIYLKPLHQTLIILWVLGCVGFLILSYHFGLTNLIYGLRENPKSIILIGPLFASLTGIGFKEFFCFRRIEAIGIAIFIPTALIGHLAGLASARFTFAMLVLSSFLLLIMGIMKFNLPAEADIGDKSVFDFLEKQRTIQKSNNQGSQ